MNFKLYVTSSEFKLYHFKVVGDLYITRFSDYNNTTLDREAIVFIHVTLGEEPNEVRT
jgi:hypothetical protein